MVHDSMKTLQYDRRLRKRRGWVKKEDYESHLGDLPDVADKGEVVSAEAPEEAPAAAAAPAPVSTGFGAPATEPAPSEGTGGSDPTLG